MRRTDTTLGIVTGPSDYHVSPPEFESETEARNYLIERLESHYILYEEVWMQHCDGTRLRIDLIALPRNQFARVGDHHCIGIEIKARYREGKNYIRALQQCIDYRHSAITDKEAKALDGLTPSLVLLFPEFEPRDEHYNDKWQAGLVRLAGRYNVGSVNLKWNRWEDRLMTRFTVAGTPIWDDSRGSCGPKQFGMARKRGSQ